MYITSELFGGEAARLHCNNTTPAYWNMMADSPPVAGLGKRKRLEGDQDQSAYDTNARCTRNSETDHETRTRPHQQQRLSPPSHRFNHHTKTTPPPFSNSEHRPVKQMKRISPKATLTKSTSHLMDLEPALSKQNHESDTHSHPHPVSDLRPCHACNSAPRRKKDLENYLDCLRCDGRTCYICARQCFGGCGKAVCKKCIVEVGEEGDPWCLDCYARDINS